MNNDTMLGGLYLLMAVMIILGSLASRREPAIRKLVFGVAWFAIFGAGFIIFSFRDDLGYLGQRLRAEAVGDPVTVGSEVRIPMAIDGHFWVKARVNEVEVRFLVDSGATMTTVDRSTALRAGIPVSQQRDQVVRTGNGMVRVASGIASEFVVGGIRRQGLRLHIADGDDMNVLGMNYLSSLSRWGVEGRWLVLES